MPGFDYGGYGDGTGWSSERGQGPEPGGGDKGHSGDHDNNNTSPTSSPAEQQISAIKNDPAIRQKLEDLLLAVHRINPTAKVSILEISVTGTLKIAIDGLSADQSKKAGLGGFIMGLNAKDVLLTIGSIESGHTLPESTVDSKNSSNGIDAVQAAVSSLGLYLSVTQGVMPAGYWLSNGKVMTKVKVERTTNGGGKGDDRTYTVLVEEEVPWLTDAYNEGVKIREEAAARAQAEADARAQAERKARAATASTLPGTISSTANLGLNLNQNSPNQNVQNGSGVGLPGTSSGTVVKDMTTVQDAIKFTSAFYKEVTEKYSEKASVLAQELAEAAKGKKIRSVDDALVAFNKYKDVLNKKYSKADRDAIARALESINRAEISASLAKFSKAFKYVGGVFDAYDVAIELAKAVETDNWRPVFVKLETIAAGWGGTALTTMAFSILAGSAVGVLGFALIMALVGAFIDDALIEKVNKLIGI